MSKGLVIVHTGNGKGKTTAAIGLGVRAVGAGLRVLMVQFIKNRETGELDALKQLANAFEVHQIGEGFTWKSDNLQKDAATALRAWEFCMEKLREENHQMLILDEINIALHYEFLPVDMVLNFLKERENNLHVVLTGRNAKQEIIDIADTVTEMKEVKHHFKKSIKAQKGIEY